MKTPHSSNLKANGTKPCPGFALVATLMLMLLLGILAVGMLSLSSISLRSASGNSAQEEAKANARMALMLAIAELQKNSGSDTRITAQAEIIEPGAPPLTGVWKSWEGTDHDSTGRPIKPDYTVKTKAEAANGRFLTWLVSGTAAGNAPDSPLPSNLVSATSTASTVPLLADGTLGTNPGQVHVEPQPVNGNTGAIAWWASPENQKARLIQPHESRTDDAAGWSDMAKTHTTPDPEPFGLESLLNDPEDFTPDPNNPKSAGKAITLASAEFLVDSNPEEPEQSFHDLSTSAVGLLTNTATGGWRKDLSLLTEKWDTIYTPASRLLSLFRYKPETAAVTQVPKPTTTNYEPKQSNFYPWSEYVQFGETKFPMTYHSPSSSWQSLVNFATKYKSINYATGMPNSNIDWYADNRNVIDQSNKTSFFYNKFHVDKLYPVVARIQMVVQANAVPDPARVGTPDAEKYHRVNLQIVPFITLWNPYNVKLDKISGADMGIETQRSLPLVLSMVNKNFPPTNPTQANYRLLNGGNSLGVDGLVGPGGTHLYDYQIQKNIDKGYTQAWFGFGVRSFAAFLPTEFSLKPGEAKIFAPGYFAGASMHTWGARLKEGYAVGDHYGMPKADPSTVNTTAGYNNLIQIPGSRPSNQLHKSDLIKFAVNADRNTKIYSDKISDKSGAGTFYSIGTSQWPISQAEIDQGGVPKGAGNLSEIWASSVDDEWAKKYWPAGELENIELTVGELIPGGGNPPWTNLFSVSFGPRLTMGAGYGNAQNRPTKGVLQSSPFVSNTYSIPEQTPSSHPANSAFDFAYHTMTTGNGGVTPDVGNKGYISTGFQSGEGLSRLIMAELPLRPMSSLAELQSWNLRGSNPLPPFQYNLIGNSDATPMMPKDDVVLSRATNVAANLQHDDAYCANHLLFDDWFFSSIAPEPLNFGKTISKDIDTVYREYLKGERQLVNRSYRPITADKSITDSLATARIAEIVNSPDGWQKVASRFEVDGMFNVNSTSVKAWRALLGHARKQQVAYYAANGIDLDPTKHEHVVSRLTVAPDVEAGVSSGMGASFQSGSEYTGFRTLSDSQLDELADKVVKQVVKRGPFLSLSEFVNRQLISNDNELALAGSLQTALKSLTKDPNEALRDPDNQLSSETMDPDPEDTTDKKLEGVGYAFPEASNGTSTFGLPGWIRQADILRSIAPVLSARDDTFTIRAYGDARDANGDVIARAWCEATVRRGREFVDTTDAADSTNPPVAEPNKLFGRRYDVVTFRWLSQDEV